MLEYKQRQPATRPDVAHKLRSPLKKLAVQGEKTGCFLCIVGIRIGGEFVVPRTRTTFQPGHKGMGGRPRGSRNRAKEDWRSAQRQADEIGSTCDALLAELAKPKRRTRMSVRQWARLQRVIATRQKAHRARSQHVRPVIPKRSKTGGMNMVFRPPPEDGGAPRPVTGTSEPGKEGRRK